MTRSLHHWQFRRQIGLLLPLLVLGLAVPGPAQVSAQANALGSPILVSGTTQVDSMACVSADQCYLAADGPANSLAIVPWTDGVAGEPTTIAGFHPNGIACSTSGVCYVVGLQRQSGQSTSPGQGSVMGAVVEISNDGSTSEQMIAGSLNFGSIACTAGDTCYAVGDGDPASGQGTLVVPIVDGQVQAPLSGLTVPLAAIACPGVNMCYGVGSAFTGVVVPLTDGAFGTPQIVPNVVNLFAIGCASVDLCYAVGNAPSPEGHGSMGAILPLVSGTPGTLLSTANVTQLDGVTCLSPEKCYVIGTADGPEAAVIPVDHGVQGAALTVAGPYDFRGIICPNGESCEAVGRYFPDLAGSGVLVPITGGGPNSSP